MELANSQRYNITDDFESVYLKEKALSRYLPKADIPPAFNQDINNAVNYLARKYFNKHKFLFLSQGFDFSDIQNVFLLWAHGFFGSGVNPNKPKKDQIRLMMHHIEQRGKNWKSCISRKFQTNEFVRDNFSLQEFDGSDDNYTGEEGEIHYNEQITDDVPELDFDNIEEDEYEEDNSEVDYGNESISLKDSLEEILEQISVCNDEETKKDLNVARKKITQDMKNESKARNSKKKAMRAELYTNPLKYKDQLCWYATTKHVSGEVRKFARAICKKYDIDYIAHTKQLIESRGYSETEFDLFKVSKSVR